MEYPRKFQIGFQEGTCPLSCKKCFAFGADIERKKEVRKMPMNRAIKLQSWKSCNDSAAHIYRAIRKPRVKTNYSALLQ